MQHRTNQLIDSLRQGASHTGQSMSNGRGVSQLAAFARQGLGEIEQILPAFPESVKPHTELGTAYEPTPQMVTEGLTGNRDYLNDRIGPPTNTAERQPHKELER